MAAVRVAGEHEVNEREAGVLNDAVGVVRFMAHEDDRELVGLAGIGHVEVGVASAGIVERLRSRGRPSLRCRGK